MQQQIKLSIKQQLTMKQPLHSRGKSSKNKNEFALETQVVTPHAIMVYTTRLFFIPIVCFEKTSGMRDKTHKKWIYLEIELLHPHLCEV